MKESEQISAELQEIVKAFTHERGTKSVPKLDVTVLISEIMRMQSESVVLSCLVRGLLLPDIVGGELVTKISKSGIGVVEDLVSTEEGEKLLEAAKSIKMEEVNQEFDPSAMSCRRISLIDRVTMLYANWNYDVNQLGTREAAEILGVDESAVVLVCESLKELGLMENKE